MLYGRRNKFRDGVLMESKQRQGSEDIYCVCGRTCGRYLAGIVV